jgi:predicted dehydrogenase
MAAALKILQLGCGSMGTRRLRDLSRRPGVELGLFDAREDRRNAARTRFGTKTFATFAAALEWSPDALVISTPPGTKGPFVELALERRIHHFVEADIWSYGAAGRVAGAAGVVCAPSLTFHFVPVVKALGEIVPAALGPLLGYQFLLAGDMASWHPTEGPEYYGRHRDTAPAREMVPFELSWLTRVFGPARSVAGKFDRFSGRGSAIEDTWSLLMQLERGGTGQLTVTMACPHNCRRGSACGVEGEAEWDINAGKIVVHTAAGVSRVHQLGEISGVIETAYAAEINCFVDAIQGAAVWPHSYAEYQFAIATLAAAEASAGRNIWAAIDPTREPDRVLAPASQ